MEIRHKDLIIDKTNPFANCQLGRARYAKILTKIVETYSTGFVLAINSEWGTGKTTFVKMWEQQLINDKYHTSYFNAWENDFDTEPLIAILGELKKLVGSTDKKGFQSLLEKGVILTKNVLPALAKGIVSKYFDADIACEAIEKSIDAATDILEKEVDEYINKKQGLVEFKAELEKYIKTNSDGKPVVFIIDELDRCRPDYAVEVLEKIKHFFSVEGIVFVLSIDKTQLGYSIQGHYGSHKIDTNEYLRRFIDVEYHLPNPDGKLFSNYLYKYYQFEEFFDSGNRKSSRELREDGSDFISFAIIFFEKNKYTLRQQEKLFSHARLVLNTFSSNNYVFPELLFLMIHLRDFEPDFYIDIKNKKLDIQQLVNKIEEILDIHTNNLESEDINVFVHTEALLILFYSNYIGKNYSNTNQLIEEVDDIEKLTFTTKTNIEGLENKLCSLICNFKKSHFTYESTSLNFLLNKIDLLENII